MNEEAAFLEAIRANAADDTARLVYADWLDEREPDRVPCPRCQGTGKRPIPNLLNGKTVDIPCEPCDQTGEVLDREPADRAELIRVQCALANLPEADECRGGLGRCGPKLKCPGCDLRRRERELLESHWHRHQGRERFLQWVLSRGALNRFDAHLPGSPHIEFSVSFVRGLWGRVTCTAPGWLAHGDAIRAAHPVTKVVLTTAVEGELVPEGFQLRFFGADYQRVMRYTADVDVTELRDVTGLLVKVWPGIEFLFDLPATS